MSPGTINFENPIRVPKSALEYAGFRAWAHSADFPETGNIAFISGTIEIDTSPEELNSHSRLKRDLSTDLNNLIRQEERGEVFFDGVLLTNEQARLSTEPDLMFCSFRSIREGRIEFAPAEDGSERVVEVRGMPDLVCEIVSNSSIRKDTVLLRKTYYDAGIPEYWLIDGRSKSLKFQILVRGRSGYVVCKTDADGYSRSRVLECDFRLVRQKNAIGTVCYRLLNR